MAIKGVLTGDNKVARQQHLLFIHKWPQVEIGEALVLPVQSFSYGELAMTHK